MLRPAAVVLAAEADQAVVVAVVAAAVATHAYSFAWSEPGRFTSALQNPNRTGMTTAMAGAYSCTVTDGSGCQASASTPVSVSTAPAAGTITGSSTVAAGLQLPCQTPVPVVPGAQAVWLLLRINSSGVVTGVAVGSTTISYRVTNACGTAYVTRPLTVSAAPNAGTISGASTVCTGATTTLTSSVTGGAWTSGNTSVATVSSAGVVTGIAPGTATISYTVSSGGAAASATRVVSVNLSANAGTITGGSSVCAGSTIVLANTATGGSWSSSTPAVATVSATGTVTGVCFWYRNDILSQ